MKRKQNRQKAKARRSRVGRGPGSRVVASPAGLTVEAVADHLGVSWATVRRKLLAVEWRDTDPLEWRDVLRAFVGDKAAALARKALADAELAEHEVRVATREVMPCEAVFKWIRDTFSPVRELTVAMPATMAPRVNPTDPAHARAHLDEWVENFLRHVRERVGQEEEKEANENNAKAR